jgi:hypothetical protein
VLDALGHDVHLPRLQRYGAVAHLNVEHAFQHEEEVVGVVVLVPDELALHLHDHDVMRVELRDGARRPVVGEGGQLL